jgi:hypothetical protein
LQQQQATANPVFKSLQPHQPLFQLGETTQQATHSLLFLSPLLIYRP